MKWLLRTFGAAAIVVVLIVVVAFAAFVFGQNLNVVNTPHGACIDVTSLGEYQANVRQLRLTEFRTGTVVWDFKAASGRSFPLWTLQVKAGENDALPENVVGAEVVVPRAATFTLVPNTEYRVDLWTYKNWNVSRHVSTKFMLRPGQSA